MQVGPLADVMIGVATDHKLTKKWLGRAQKIASAVSGGPVGLELLHSTLGRHLARGIRAGMLSELALQHWQHLVDNIGTGDTDTFVQPEFPKGEVMGCGMHEAPRGLLSHWVVIKDGKIANYQAVVPSTWNAGPRDDKGNRGPYEESLIANPVADPEKPLEVLRTIHSFDPCLACAIHTTDIEGREISRVNTL
jgi:hydrogenase large subunit